MRESPDGQNLLACARATLLEKVLPLIPQEQRYSALMIANAMAIALRQWQAGEAWQIDELARLQTLLQDDYAATTIEVAALAQDPAFYILESNRDNASLDKATLQRQLLRANQCLAKKIRAGHFDKPSDEFVELLQWMATQRVKESSPKYLQVPR